MNCEKCGKEMGYMEFNTDTKEISLRCSCGFVSIIPAADSGFTVDQFRRLLDEGWTPPRKPSKLEKAIEEIKAAGVELNAISGVINQAIKNIEGEIYETLHRR